MGFELRDAVFEVADVFDAGLVDGVSLVIYNIVDLTAVVIWASSPVE